MSPGTDPEARLDGAIDEVRRMARGLRPSVLDDFGLGIALERHVEEVSGLSGVHVDFECAREDDARERLARSAEVVLYRIAQEALTNVIRHADASRVSVVLVLRTKEARLVIEDDGCGFDPLEVAGRGNGCGLGLLGMRERAALIGGDLAIESTRGSGTTVRAVIPIEGDEA